MPEKKNQHLVPACYLRNFMADVSEQQRVNPNYESGVYINDKTLSSGWKLRSVNHSTFTKPYYYNLPEDDPKQPLIENYLAKVESDYPKYFDEIHKGITNNENMSFMSYFATLQCMRVEAFIEPIQDVWNKIASHINDFERDENYTLALNDIAKRHLATTDLGYTIHPHSTIIYNSTRFPFLTSDNPVVRKRINISDAQKIIPKEYLLQLDNESTEFLLFFFPLSPQLAYISCELIKANGNIIYSDNDINNIFYLNYISIINSYSKVYSPVIEPIKGQAQLSQLLSSDRDTIIKIYTQSKRIVSGGSLASESTYKITVSINDLEQIKAIKPDDEIRLVEVIDNGLSIRGMRDCRISSIDYANGIVSIQSFFQLNV